MGSVWMVLSMALFALEDTFIKAASETYALAYVLIWFGLGGAAVFAALAHYRKERLFNPDVLSTPMCVRVVFEIVGRLFYFLAITLIPLSVATVILQATPIVVVLGAVLFMQEKVGWRRWLAIVMGLIGVVIVVRPGTEQFSVLALLAVVGVFGFAGRDLASRAAPASIGTNVLGFYGFLSITVAGVLYWFWQVPSFAIPSIVTMGWMIGAIVAGVLAYSALMLAMRTGEVSAVTPFRYTRLLFGVALGALWFGEPVDALMLIGCAVIVLSGWFLVRRSREKPIV